MILSADPAKKIILGALALLAAYSFYYDFICLKERTAKILRISGALSAKTVPKAGTRAFFTLCSLVKEHYPENVILVTPHLDREENLRFNQFFQFNRRWQILQLLRYPDPIVYKDYRWDLSRKEARSLLKLAEVKKKSRWIMFNLVPLQKGQRELAVFIFRKNVILAPLQFRGQ